MTGLFDLSGRVALVTGAGQGVGAAVARTLARQGAAVAVNDLSPQRAMDSAQTLCEVGRAFPAAADITDSDAVASMVGEVEGELGGVDILINNAGIPVTGMSLQRFVDTTPADWQPFVSLNVYGVLNCTHQVVPGMIERGWGRVITVVSDAERVGEPNQAVYAASKAAAAGFSRSLAKEVGRDGVTCNCVSLGTIEHEDRLRDPELRAKQVKLYPARRLGQPMDAATAIAWLAAEETSWVTGQTIPINGGYSTTQ